MGTLDDLKDTLGADFFTRPARTGEENRVSWQPLCVCGHLAKYHSATVGGAYVLPDPGMAILRGVTYTKQILFNGCRGALALRDFETETTATDHETKLVTQTITPTCPCDDFREVAQVDRPNRYFNQRLPLDLRDRDRHPFLIGLRAFAKHLHKRRAALADPTWADREFDRRFTWSESRVCSISKCTVTDGVLPAFVSGDRSELRCPKHR